MVQVAKQWDTDSIKQLLATNDVAVHRALIVIYDRQTAEEKATFSTRSNNGQGFTAADAVALTRLAKVILARPLSPAEIQEARPRLMKYSRQLLDMIVSKQLAQLSS